MDGETRQVNLKDSATSPVAEGRRCKRIRVVFTNSSLELGTFKSFIRPEQNKKVNTCIARLRRPIFTTSTKTFHGTT